MSYRKRQSYISQGPAMSCVRLTFAPPRTRKVRAANIPDGVRAVAYGRSSTSLREILLLVIFLLDGCIYGLFDCGRGEYVSLLDCCSIAIV